MSQRDNPGVRSRPRRAVARPFYADYLPYLVASAAFLILDDFHALLKRFRMPVAEWRTLAALADGRGLTIGQLARVTLSKQPTLSRQVDRLEARGLVRRTARPEDMRQSLVTITAAGRRRVAPVVATARRHEERVLAELPARDVAALKQLLKRSIAAFEERAR